MYQLYNVNAWKTNFVLFCIFEKERNQTGERQKEKLYKETFIFSEKLQLYATDIYVK
jgi:hypothetical protein